MENVAKTKPIQATQNRRVVLEQWLERLLPFFGIGAFLVVWQIAVSVLEVPTYLLPAPTEIIVSIRDNFSDLLQHGWVTTYEMVLGYLMAIAISVPLAVAITASPRFDRFITPILLFSQTIPKIAIAPLFLVWFGFGPFPKILVAFLISFFPIVIDTTIGLKSVSPEMLDLVRSMGATKLQVFLKIRLPTSLPYMFGGLKVAATLAVVGAIVGEFVGADKGLGYLLLIANSYLDTPLLFAAIVGLTTLGIILFYIIEGLERLLIPWHAIHRTKTDHHSSTM